MQEAYIPPDVISYYKRFGLSEEEIELFFKQRPPAAASPQGSGLRGLREASPGAAGRCAHDEGS